MPTRALTDEDPILKEARTKLLTILGDEQLVDYIMKIVERTGQQTEKAERAPQWREGGHLFY